MPTRRSGWKVALDGQPIGTAPLWRERFRSAATARLQGPGVRAWEEEVQVKAGQSARVTAAPVKVPPYGLVTARAELVSSDGVEDLEGIPSSSTVRRSASRRPTSGSPPVRTRSSWRATRARPRST
jgi:hypothetical protein